MTRILAADGSLNPTIVNDVRIERAQQRKLLRVAEADPDAEVVGMDARQLPVIRARLGGAKRPSEFALYARGRTTTVQFPLLEEWTVDGDQA